MGYATTTPAPAHHGASHLTSPHDPPSGLIYLASPYSDPLASTQELRFEQACSATARLMERGWMVFSPIVHCHPLAARHHLPTDAAYWEKYNRTMLSHSDELWVLHLTGWRESVGVAGEILMAEEMHLPVRHIDPDTLTYVHGT